MLVKPRTRATVVRDPRTFVQLPPEGKRVPDTSYWIRRLKCGDVVKTSAEAIAKGKADRIGKAKHEAKESTAKTKQKTKQEPTSKGGE